MSIANPFQQSLSHHTAEDPKLRRWAATASVTVAFTLIAAKLGAYLMTDSVSLLSSLMDSTLDAVASVVTMISIRHAAEPADESHRYGHGKLESLSALGQAIFITGSATFLFYEALFRFINPHPVAETGIGVAVMLLSIGLTLLLVLFQRHVVKKTGSVAIEADHLHYKGDLLMNASVIAALVIGKYTGWMWIDPVFALGIGALLLKSAWEISRSSYDILMDREIPAEDRETIYNIVIKHPEVRAMHDLRTRTTGHHVFIEFHLEMDGHMTLAKAHDVTEEIEMLVYKAFPRAEVLIHQEPAGIEDHRLDERVKKY